MAEDIRSMRVELSMRDMGIERTVGNIKQAFRTMKSEVSNATRMFDRAEKSTSEYWYQLKNLKTAQANYKNELKAAVRQEAKMVEQHGQNSTQALRASEAVAQLKEQIDYTGRQIKTTTAEMEQFKVAQRVDRTPWAKMGKNIQGIGAQLGTISEKTGKVGMSLTKNITRPAGLAAAAVGGIALAKGWSRLVEIDNAKAKLSALGNSGKNVETIMTNANKAVKGTSFGMGEAATTAANAVAAGIKPGKELTQYLTNTGDAAAIAGVGMDEMGRILNKVQTSNKAYNGELQELSDRGLPVYQWLAKEAGIAENEVADFAASGQVTSKMLQDAIQNNIGGAAKKMGEKSFTASLANMWAALGRVGAGFLDAGGKGGGFFSKMKPIMNNLTTMFDGMQGTAEQWGVKLGSALNTVLAMGVKVKNFYDGLPGPIQSVIKSTMLWGSLTLVAIGPMLLAFSKLTGAISMVFGPFGGFLTTIGKVAVASKNAGGIIAGITTLFPKLGAALTLATGPVGLTIAAIVALGAALVIAYKKSETFRNIVNGVFSFLGTVLTGIWNNVIKPVFSAIGQIFVAVMNQFKQAGNEILPVLANHFKLAFGQAGAVVGTLQPIVTTVFNAIKNVALFVLPGIKAMFNNTFQGIKNIVTGAFDIILGALKIFAALFTGNSKLLWSGVKQIFSGFIKIIVGIFRISFVGQILSFARGMVKSVTGVFRNLGVVTRAIFSALGKWIGAKWQAIRNSVVNKVKSLWNGVKATWAALKTGTINIIASVGTWLGKKWQAIRNSVVAKVKSLWSGVSKTWHSLKSGTVKIMASVGSWLSKTWTSIKNAVINRAKSLWNGVRNTFNALNKGIHNIFNSVKNFTLKLWTSVKNGVVSRAKSLWNNVKNVFNSLKKGVSNIFNSVKNTAIKIWNSIKKSVVNLANGAKNGVVNGFKAMFNKGKEWLNKLLGFIKNAKTGFKNAATSLGKSVANGAISGLNAMIDGINSLSNKIMKKKLIKNKIPKLSTGTGASPGVQTNSQGQLTKSTKAVINDKGIGNAKGPNGHREIIQRRNGKFEKPSGRNKVVRLKRGDAVHNGMQSKALRPHLSTGTLPHLSLGSFAGDLLNKGKKKVQHGYHETLDTSKNLVEDGKKWAGDKAKSFSKAIGDVMSYVKNPMKLVDKTLKHFGVDFSNIKGAMGGTMSWAYNGLKNGMKDLVGKWLEDAQGGDGDAGWLLKHKILQYFGHYTGGLNFNGGRHYGIDFAMPMGSKIKALTDGTVTQAGPVTGGGGNQVTIKEPGGKWFQWYMHMSKVLANKGDKVKTGDLLGRVGMTGNTTTPHLHIQRMKGYPSNETAVDPMKWLKSLGSTNKSAKKWKSDIQRAAKQMKVNLSNSELNGIIAQIQRESNGNAGVTQGNIGDINNLRGTPAQGLLQYVPSTFKSYAVKGHTNIKSGYDQLLAFFNNKNWRKDLPYGKSGWGPSGGRRFATGGVINSNGMYNIAEDGHSEVVVPLDPKRATDAMKLISYAQSKVKDKKNKKPNQISNRYSTSSGSDNTELLMQMINELQTQNSYLKEIVRSNQGIEDKAGFNEREVSQAQGRKARMKAYARGGAIV